MPKKNIKDELIKKSIKDIANMFKGINPPTEELKTYLALQNYFANAEYTLKTKGNKTMFSINHKDYYILKIYENIKTPIIKSLKITKNDNDLEAKIVLNIRFVDNEIKILATKNNNDKYYCKSITYNGIFSYHKEKCTHNK